MSLQLSSTMEDYLETIYELQRTDNGARVKDIARLMQVKMPSVTSAVRTLKQEGLITQERYRAIELTERGREVAEDLRRRHILLAGFLTDILQLDAEQADGEACELEHGLSRETLRRLTGLIEFIKRCPRCGEDWLNHLRGRWEDCACDHDCRECVAGITIPEHMPFEPIEPTAATMTLDQQEPGFKGVVVRVAGNGRIRKRLMEMGVTAGTEIEFERVAPLGDPLEIRLRGYHLSLRKEEAATVYVEPK